MANGETGNSIQSITRKTAVGAEIKKKQELVYKTNLAARGYQRNRKQEQLLSELKQHNDQYKTIQIVRTVIHVHG